MAEFEDFDEFQEQLEGNDLAALQEEDFNDEFNDETFGGEISDDVGGTIEDMSKMSMGFPSEKMNSNGTDAFFQPPPPSQQQQPKQQNDEFLFLKPNMTSKTPVSPNQDFFLISSPQQFQGNNNNTGSNSRQSHQEEEEDDVGDEIVFRKAAHNANGADDDVGDLIDTDLLFELDTTPSKPTTKSSISDSLLAGDTQKQLFSPPKSPWESAGGSFQYFQQVPTERVPVSLEDLEAQFAKAPSSVDSSSSLPPTNNTSTASVVPQHGMPFGSPGTNPNSAMFQNSPMQGSPFPMGAQQQQQRPAFTGSPMKMNFDEQQQQQQQEEERRSPLADSKYMLSEEIEMIIRTQLAQLNVQNPYFEDYYYFTFMAKKNPNQARILPPNINFISALQSGHAQKSDEPQDGQNRFLGRTHAQNIRAPRMLVQVSASLTDPESQSSLFKESKLVLLGTIESCLTQLLDVEDIRLALEHTSSNFANELKRRLDEISFKIVSSLKMAPNQQQQQQPQQQNNGEENDGIPFVLKIAKFSKGVRLVCKALKLLPEPHYPIIIDNCLANWPVLMDVIEDDQDRQALISTIEKRIGEISPYGLVQRLQFSTLKLEQVKGAMKTETGIILFLQMIERVHFYLQNVNLPPAMGSDLVGLSRTLMSMLQVHIPEILSVQHSIRGQQAAAAFLSLLMKI